MGTGEIGVPTLWMLARRDDCEVVGVVTQPDRPAGRGGKVRESAIKSVAREMGAEVLQPERLRKEASVAELAALRPDVVVVMAYGQILSREVLDVPPVACLNLHASLLPRWRGAAPIQAAIAAGDKVTGITVMHMAEGLDTGDVLLKREIPISSEETGGSLHDRLADLAPAALAEALDSLIEGGAPRTPQDEAEVTLTRKLSREDGWIDWSRSATAIERLIRAMNPWPAASGEVRIGGVGRRLKIFSAKCDDLEGVGEVGGLIEDAGEVRVMTGKGVLVLGEIQAEGRKRMAAAEWLRGLR